MGVAGADAAVRVNGDAMSLGDAVKVIKGRMARRAAAAYAAQTDLEGATGTAPGQEAREVEAGGIAADRLRSIIHRVERLEEARKALAGDVKDVMAEAKSAGFDVPTIRRIIKLRRIEPDVLENQDALLDLYRRALGM